MREVFQALFPEGLTFRPAENAARRVWAISGTARLDSLKLSSDPSGIRTPSRRRRKPEAHRGLAMKCLRSRRVRVEAAVPPGSRPFRLEPRRMATRWQQLHHGATGAWRARYR
jgi:hypothetical protein